MISVAANNPPRRWHPAPLIRLSMLWHAAALIALVAVQYAAKVFYVTSQPSDIAGKGVCVCVCVCV